VLEVAIHDRDVWRCTRQNAFDTGRGQTAPANALQASHIRVMTCERAHRIGGAVRRIVTDKYHFPSNPLERCFQPLQQKRLTLSRSLKVGTTRVSSAERATVGVPAAGLSIAWAAAMVMSGMSNAHCAVGSRAGLVVDAPHFRHERCVFPLSREWNPGTSWDKTPT
jgi:hypothetical protein